MRVYINSIVSRKTVRRPWPTDRHTSLCVHDIPFGYYYDKIVTQWRLQSKLVVMYVFYFCYDFYGFGPTFPKTNRVRQNVEIPWISLEGFAKITCFRFCNIVSGYKLNNFVSEFILTGISTRLLLSLTMVNWQLLKHVIVNSLMVKFNVKFKIKNPIYPITLSYDVGNFWVHFVSCILNE